MRLCDRVHAKLFRFDDVALVGSANLTAAALGWSANPNLELLIEVPARAPEVAVLEASLARDAVPASAEIAAAVERAAALLPTVSPKVGSADSPPLRPGSWHPLLREPRDLTIAYSQGPDRLSSASATAAAADLSALEIHPAPKSRPSRP